MLGVHRDTARSQICEQLMGESAEVDICARIDTGRSDGLRCGAAGNKKGRPRTDRGGVVAELHTGEQRMPGEGLMPFAKVFDVGFAPHEAHVRNRVDESGGLGEMALAHEVRPELAGDLELLVDLHRARDLDRSIRPLRRVIQFAQRRMSGPRVVPRIRRLECDLAQTLVHPNAPVGLELRDESTESGTHDSAPDKYNVDGVRIAHYASLRPHSP